VKNAIKKLKNRTNKKEKPRNYMTNLPKFFPWEEEE